MPQSLIGAQELHVGSVVQVVTVQSNASVVYAGAGIPSDNTIPQSNEGVGVPLNLSFTPKSALNLLHITGIVNVAENGNTGNYGVVALFRDAEVGSFCVTGWSAEGGQNSISAVPISFFGLAGSVATRIYKVRISHDGLGVNFNSSPSGPGNYGGVLTSNLRVTEVSA